MENQNAEQTFREFCDQAGIQCDRVPEVNEEKRPDYEIFVSGQKIIVEIKQFDPNPEEKKALKDLEKKGHALFGDKPGARVREAIRKAAPQLRTLSKGKIPAMLVLQTNILGRHTKRYDIMTAMQGLDTISVTVPEDPNISLTFGDAKRGPKKKMTRKDNTKISAVAVIRESPAGTYELDVYHNSFAANPIDPEWLRQQGIRHWRIPKDSTSSLTSWECI